MNAKTPDARLVPFQLMCISFIISTLIAFHLFDMRAVLQLDVWFHADPDLRLSAAFSSGIIELKHPNIGVIVGLPIAALSWLLRLAGIGAGSPDANDLWLVTLVPPVCAALRTLCTYKALRLLTGNLRLAILLSLLDIVAFEALTIGSVPESFALSATCIAAMYWTMESDAADLKPIRSWRWTVIGTVAMAVTLTNVVPLTILLAVAIRRRRLALWPGVRIMSGVVLAATAINAVGVVSRLTVRGIAESYELDTGSTINWTHAPTLATATQIGWAMAHTILAPTPALHPGVEPQADNPDYDFQIVYPPEYSHDASSWWRALAALGMLAIGVWGYVSDKSKYLQGSAALAILGANFLLHLWYGHYYFLYGLHWQLSLIWLVAGMAFLPAQRRLFATAVLTVFLMITAANSWYVLQQLFAILRTS